MPGKSADPMPLCLSRMKAALCLRKKGNPMPLSKVFPFAFDFKGCFSAFVLLE